MLGGRPEDIVFTSGGTEANNMVIHTACRHFHDSQRGTGDSRGIPHIVTSSVEHDSIRLPLEQLGREGLAETTFVPVSPRSGQAEVDDVVAAIQPNTCLVSLMLANNETGVIMPVAELSQRVRALNRRRAAEALPRVLLHTDAAQMIGKGRVDVQELGVDYLTVVGHKFHGPRIGALYIHRPGTATPLHPMLFGGGQERSFRPGTENTPMIAGLGQAAELVNKNWEAYEAHMRDVRDYLEATLEASFGKQRIHFNSRFKGSKRLCNTCNFSILGPGLQGRRVLAHCKVLLASVGAACHSEKGDRRELECSIASWKEFVPPSFGYPAELGSTFELLALPEESLPCVCVCLAHLLQPCLGLQMAPFGDVGTALPSAAELRGCPGGGAERAAAERGAWHHTGRCGQGCAGPRAGCGTAAAGPGPLEP
ncbi:selenocysteine lyase isoform X3 [Passer montanus]|nr:selenocysteine lyase isoform X3 [Passer montanus]